MDKQLSLTSGQHLWEAFLYLDKTCQKEFTFKFTFEVNESFGASISLCKCEDDSDNPGRKVFSFKITCNKIFATEDFSGEEIVEKNVLCRPCLIKLNGKYHLREQKLPFFITLAHEFLHALNQLERIQETFSQLKVSSESDIDLNTKIDEVLTIQKFLCKKLCLEEDSVILAKEYKELWQNGGVDDSLDEMVVILGWERNIAKTEKVLIGETAFLREFYNDATIVSWSHDSAHEYEFYRVRMNTLLEPKYVECVLKTFFTCIPTLSNITQSDNCAKIISFEGSRSSMRNVSKEAEEKIKESSEEPRVIRLKRKGSTISQFISYPLLNGVKLLPVVSSKKTVSIITHGYTIVDVPADGDCAFTAIEVAQKDKRLDIKALRNSIADKMKEVLRGRDDFIRMFRQPGFWSSGINGGVDIEVLSFVAKVIKRPILVITPEPDGNYRYWVSGTVDNPRDGNLAFHAITKEALKGLLEDNPSAVKLLHNGIYFQAIAKEEFFLPPPPTPSCTVTTDISMMREPAFSAIGTPPFSTENQGTIPFQLEMQLATDGYRIQDVPSDGNCAFYAYAFSADVGDEPASLREAALGSLEKFRRSTSESEDTKAVMDELAYRLKTNREWMGIDDLKWLGQSQARDIIVIQPKPGSADHVLIHRPTASEGTPLEVEMPVGQLCGYIGKNKDSVFLYYNGINHFQAIVRNDSLPNNDFERTPSHKKTSLSVSEKK